VGHKPDFESPVVLTSDRGGTSVEAMCKQIHNTMVREFNYALVWGRSAKHSPQRVGLSHQLSDEDVIQVGGVVGGGVGGWVGGRVVEGGRRGAGGEQEGGRGREIVPVPLIHPYIPGGLCMAHSIPPNPVAPGASPSASHNTTGLAK
jgi:hypothetical protein